MDRSRKPSSVFVNEFDTNTFEYLSWRRLHLSKSKLSGVAELGSFMAGFAVVATVELQISDEGNNPILLTVFVVTTAILVATSMLTILIATCILPQLEAVTKIAKCPSKEISRSPHDALVNFIDLSWILANTVCLFLFTLDVILVVWIKWTSFGREISIAGTVILIPVLVIILVFGVVFYRKIVKHQHDIFSKKYLELEDMQRNLEQQIETLSLDMLEVGTGGTQSLDLYYPDDSPVPRSSSLNKCGGHNTVSQSPTTETCTTSGNASESAASRKSSLRSYEYSPVYQV